MKKVLKFILISVLALAMMSFIACGENENGTDPAENAVKWEGTVATNEEMAEIYDEETATYSITTGSQLAWIAQMTNSTDNAVRTTFAGKTVKLLNDINLADIEWTPIGSNTMKSYPSYTFAGTFDGGNFTIYNLKVTSAVDNYSCAGLFGTLNGNAVVKNVTVYGADIVSDHYAGGIVAYVSGGEVTISNCAVKNSSIKSAPRLLEDGVSYDNGDKVGGIIGYANNITITDCTIDTVAITAYRHIGGIAGYVSGILSIESNSVSSVILTQDNTNGYKTDVTNLVSEFIGNAVGGPTIGENTKTNVIIKNV